MDRRSKVQPHFEPEGHVALSLHLERLLEERDYLEINVRRAGEAIPCDLLKLAALLRELAAVEQLIVDYKEKHEEPISARSEYQGAG